MHADKPYAKMPNVRHLLRSSDLLMMALLQLPLFGWLARVKKKVALFS